MLSHLIISIALAVSFNNKLTLFFLLLNFGNINSPFKSSYKFQYDQFRSKFYSVRSWSPSRSVRGWDAKSSTADMYIGIRLALPLDIIPIIRQPYPHHHIHIQISTIMVTITAMMPILLSPTIGMPSLPILGLPTSLFWSLPTTSIHPRNG